MEVRLAGRYVELRQLTPQDYGFLYHLSTDPRSFLKWRHRGSAPPPDRFSDLLWQDIFTQYLIVSVEHGDAIGLVQAFGADFRVGSVSFAMIVAPEFEGSGAAIEGAAILIDLLFRAWQFRKIYIESLEFSAWQFWSGRDSILTLEGCLRDHEYHDGQYWHMYLFAIFRETWREQSERWLGQAADKADGEVREPPEEQA